MAEYGSEFVVIIEDNIDLRLSNYVRELCRPIRGLKVIAFDDRCTRSIKADTSRSVRRRAWLASNRIAAAF
jgi:hypothetical protein